MSTRRDPVLVGLAQLTEREKTTAQLDPIEMMAGVCSNALLDAGLSAPRAIDALGIVNCISKPLQDPASQLSSRLGIDPSWRGYTSIGATAPQWFVHQLAERIYTGETDWALVCGAEAFYTEAPVTSLTGLVDSAAGISARFNTPFVGDTRIPVTPLELRYGLVTPVHMYALIENAVRASRGLTMTEHREELAAFCAAFSQRAAENKYAWSREPRKAEDVARLSKENRLVSFPYTKLMCSNATVNQAAAVLMTSATNAEAAGISKDKLVFVRGCGEAEDAFHPSERPALSEGPSVVDAANQALSQASVELADLDYVDLYSCFPSAPRIVARTLGLDDRPPETLTVTGGMACFGGPGNNYALHAVCEMCERLRQDPDAVGLVHALSWYISKHCIGVYAAQPGATPWRPDEGASAPTYPKATVIAEANGAATIESYALTYDRRGEPKRAVVIGRDENDHRFLARAPLESDLLDAMTKTEIIGLQGTVRHDASTHLNVFALR